MNTFNLKLTIFGMILIGMLALASAFGYAVSYTPNILNSLVQTSPFEEQKFLNADINAIVWDGGNYIYYGGQENILARYSISANTTTNISNGNTGTINTMAYSTATGKLYFDAPLDLMEYDSGSGIISVAYNINDGIQDIEANSVAGQIYFMRGDSAGSGYFYKYEESDQTAEDWAFLIDSALINSQMATTSMEDMSYDSIRNKIYFVSQDADFISLNLNDNTTESYPLSQFNSAYKVLGIGDYIFHNSDFVAGFYDYNTATSQDLPEELSTETDSVYYNAGIRNLFAYDNSNNLLYVGNKGSSVPIVSHFNLSVAGVFKPMTNLSYENELYFATGDTNGIVYDSINGLVFGVGSQGTFWVFDIDAVLPVPPSEPETPTGNVTAEQSAIFSFGTTLASILITIAVVLGIFKSKGKKK